jgi:hypothetical protein
MGATTLSFKSLLATLSITAQVIHCYSECCGAAARVSDAKSNFYFVENHKIAYNKATTKDQGEISTDLGFLELLIFFMFNYERNQSSLT